MSKDYPVNLVQQDDLPEKEELVRSSSDLGFQQWMSRFGGTIVLTSPSTGKVAVLGWDGKQVTLLLRQFDYPTGLAAHGDQLLVTSRQRITLFANNRQLAYGYKPQVPGLYDACYLPRASWYVGEVYPRETAFDRQGMVFVNTRFSCLARPSFKYHFETVWKPSFISDIVPEDRCHISGLAIVDGQPAYVTTLGTSDTSEGWKENRLTSGALINVRSNQVLLNNLCLPHSPRWYRECLWFLNSGLGELWVMNPRTYETKAVCSLPGFARGLEFWTDPQDSLAVYAVIGLSEIRENEKNTSFPLLRKNQQPLCGVVVLNILTGKVEGTFQFQQGCTEIFDLQILPQVRRAAMLTLNKPACHEAVTCDVASWWIRSEG